MSLTRKVVLIGLFLAIAYQIKNYLLAQVKSRDEWQRSRIKKDMKNLKKFENAGVIGEGADDYPIDMPDETEPLSDYQKKSAKHQSK